MPVHIHHEVQTIYDVSVYFDLIKNLALYVLIYLGLRMFRKDIAAILKRITGFKGLGVEAILGFEKEIKDQMPDPSEVHQNVEPKSWWRAEEIKEK